MKATEIVKLMEMMKTFPQKEQKERPMRRPRYTKHLHDEDITSLLHRKLAEADMLKKLLDDREKANKKEEKKDKKGLSLEQFAILLVLTYPLIGMILMYAKVFK